MSVQKTESNQNQSSIQQKIILFFLLALIGLITFYGCKKEDEIEIAPLEIEAHIIQVSKVGGSDGIINLTVKGGILPYSFLWSNNQTSEDLIDISSGIYTVEVFDAEYHSHRDTFKVTEPEAIPMFITFYKTNPSEQVGNDGSVTCEVEGGYPPFTFEWSNGATTKDIENLNANSYVLTITDSKGQLLTDTIALIETISSRSNEVSDIDGNLYQTIQIGTQTWMNENLRVTHAPDSSEITSYTYNDNPANEAVYGRLYTWNTAMNHSTQEKAQGICPDGWHIPSDEEFKKLEMHLGMSREEADLTNTWRGANVGTKLKYGGTSGFDIMLSGGRTENGTYSLAGRKEYLWTSTEFENDFAWRRCFEKFANDVGRWNTFTKKHASSIRCIKNDE